MSPADLLVSTIAVIHDAVPSPVNLFSEETLRGLVRPPLNVFPTMDSFRIVSNRDQIELVLSPVRSEVRDFSGDVEKASSKLSDVLKGLMGLLAEPVVRSYGINFLLESRYEETEEVAVWLGQHFLRDNLTGDLGTPVSCDEITFSYEREDKSQTINIEVTGDSTVIINSSASEQTDALPDKSKLEVELKSQHDYIFNLLRKVGFN